ncbi:MAG: hypothetical protein GXY90_04310 [Peptococcaceae bacterium]|nr:hypothetical protein [Peptococcaceae bacterium]
MRIKGRRIWALAIAGALLVFLLCLLAGCGKTQSTETTPGSTQAPGQEAVDQASPDSTQAPGQEQAQPGMSSNGEQKADKPGKKVEILKNGSFEMGHYGWSPQEGTIITEDDGNKCVSVKYSWGLYQFLEVHQGQTYEITCQVRQDQEPISTARMCIIFYSKDHKILNERTVDIIHIPGNEWEDIPPATFTVPKGAAFTKLFLLSNGHGSVCFDNISITPVAGDSAEAEKS